MIPQKLIWRRCISQLSPSFIHSPQLFIDSGGRAWPGCWLAISQHQIEIKTNDVNMNPSRQASLLKYFHRLINNITNENLKRTVKKVSEVLAIETRSKLRTVGWVIL